ncbi:MAG: TIM barrel protein [Planctomycetes bacterium]|nr:TIM barrel protein [Planctomycetota bacterium]MBL7038771.1 TIM barrel protein [Pirellulaceae bacterium]
MDKTDRSNGRTARQVSRRDVLRCAATAGPALIGTGGLGSCVRAGERAETGAKNGRLNQSIVHWCFAKYWDVEKTCQIAKQLGCKSVELVEPKYWPMLKRHGLVCAIAGSHWFDKGMNNPKYHEMCLAKLREAIDACADFGFPNVITFTGLAEDIPADEGAKNCVAGYKKIVGYAEKMKVNICLEILNSRVPIEMVGVPGYQGDHTDYCMDIVKQVGSPRMKLLFDVFHVQIMDGDIISRIRQYKDYIGHYHTAGNPGRRELDDTQEINYRPVMKAIADTGFSGYIGHEFIPTRDPLKGLSEAVTLCTV